MRISTLLRRAEDMTIAASAKIAPRYAAARDAVRIATVNGLCATAEGCIKASDKLLAKPKAKAKAKPRKRAPKQLAAS